MGISPAYNQARQGLALKLWEVGAVLTVDSNHPSIVERRRLTKKHSGRHRWKERGFKLHQHRGDPKVPLSPFHLNFHTGDHPKKPGPLTPETIDLVAQCMRNVEFQNRLQCSAVVGVPRAGDPFAAALAKLSGASCIELEKIEHGDTRYIGPSKRPIPRSAQKAMLVDCLVTGASSKIEAVTALEDNQVEVTDVMVIVDHEQGGREKLSELGIRLHAVFTATELFDFYFSVGKISSRLHNKIRDYLRLQPA